MNFLRNLLFTALMTGVAFTSAADAAQPNNDWATENPKSLGWKTQNFEQIAAGIEKQEFKKVTSVLVAHKGKLIYEGYFNNGHADYMNDLRSATKSITSLMVGKAIEDGHIKSVQQKAFALIADKKSLKGLNPLKKAITIQDLLTMSSILECNDDNSYSAGNEERMYISFDWVKFVLGIPVKGYAPWEPRPEKSAYNRSFSYCTAGTFLLGAIVEKTSGKKMDEYAKQALDSKLNIESVKWSYSNHGITSGAGGTRYKSRDFLKFGELFRNGGRWNGEQVINQKWVEESTKTRVEVRPNVEYGYFWWKFAFDVNGKKYWSYAASGNGGNYLFVQPDLELVTLITSEFYNSRQGHQQSQKIYSDFILAGHPKVLNH